MDTAGFSVRTVARTRLTMIRPAPMKPGAVSRSPSRKYAATAVKMGSEHMRREACMELIFVRPTFCRIKAKNEVPMAR